MIKIQREIRSFIDIDALFKKHPITNNIALKKDVNAIKQSIVNLLLLKSGDKPFHPEIESPVYKFLFENSSPVVSFVLQEQVIKYLDSFEPRFSVSDVQVQFPNVNEIILNIVGTVINTTEPVTITVLVDRLR